MTIFCLSVHMIYPIPYKERCHNKCNILRILYISKKFYIVYYRKNYIIYIKIHIIKKVNSAN